MAKSEHESESNTVLVAILIGIVGVGVLGLIAAGVFMFVAVQPTRVTYTSMGVATTMPTTGAATASGWVSVVTTMPATGATTATAPSGPSDIIFVEPGSEGVVIELEGAKGPRLKSIRGRVATTRAATTMPAKLVD